MEQIKHSGRITHIKGPHIEVEVISSSACHDCEAKASCGLMECLKKKIEVESANAADFAKGEEVWVGLDAKTGLKAVAYTYILPLFVVLIGLMGALFWGYSEQMSGIFSIILLIPYYFGLFLSQKRKTKHLQFTISKK